VYAYDPQFPVGTGSGTNYYTRDNVALAAGRRYRIEQHVKLNTKASDGTWNSDGLMEIWVNGVKALSMPNYKVRANDYGLIQDVPFLNFYWGGQTPADRVMHFQIGNVIASKAYVGLARCDKQ
jgi:hypothetical protein